MPIEDFHEEEVLEGKVYDSHLVRRVWKYIVPHRRIVINSILLLPVVAALQILQPFVVKEGIDRYFHEGSSLGLSLIAALFFVVLIAKALAEYFQLYWMALTGQRCLSDLRLDLFQHIQRLPTSFFDRTPVGRTMTRLTNDVEVLSEMFTSGVVALVGDFIKLIAIFVVMLAVQWKLTLVTFAAVPLVWIVANLFRKKMRQAYRLIRSKIARINVFLQESITGMKIVQLFAREKKNLGYFQKINEEYRQANRMSIQFDALLFSLVEMIGRFAIAMILWYGSGLHQKGWVTLGTLYLFIDLMQQFFVPLRDLSAKYAVLQSAMASLERIFGLFDEKVASSECHPEPRLCHSDPALAGEESRRYDGILHGACPERSRRVQDDKKEEERKRGIIFQNIWFSYRPNQPVLKGISFEIRPGEKIALVGATGAGKSSIIKLLVRLYDYESGEIRMGGRELRSWPLEELRREVVIVPQDVYLFSGSILENITLGDPLIPAERAKEAARIVNAERFILNLPYGYDYEVGERGATLSVGQKQLLSFARALVRDPKVLILDEATSSVSPDIEELVRQGIHRLMEERTTLVIAHRLSTIRDVDRIIVLHHGEVREMGTHEQLLALKGIYARLYELQYRPQEG